MRQRILGSLLATGVALGVVIPAHAAPVKFEQYQLPNGLKVILHHDPSTPIVVVNVNYHVGSKNEKPGRTGFAHLFEHVMFEGSKHAPQNFFHYVEPVGAQNNAYTTQDRTNYYEVLPSNHLERGLFLEADRMSTLLDVLDISKLDNQRDIVKNEKRQRYNNRPYGMWVPKLATMGYQQHGYGWATIGSMADLNAATLDDVKDFFRTYYVPNNATLVVAGDFDANQAKSWINQYFGSIKRGADIVRPSSFEPPITQAREATISDKVQFPAVMTVYRAAKSHDRDSYPMELLATVLGTGESSRLHKRLVRELKIAQNVAVFNWTKEDHGELHIHATAAPGHTNAELEKALAEELAKVRTQPVTARELQKAKNVLEAQRQFSLETVQARADVLADYATLFHDPDLINREPARYEAQTSADLLRVAQQYLDPERRIVLRFVPEQTAAKEAAK